MKEYAFHLFLIIFSIIVYLLRFKIANHLNLLDYPDNSRKSHSLPIPAIGGLIIFPYITLALIYMNLLSLIKIKILLIWLILYFTFFITGIIDDKIHLNAKSKSFILLFILLIVIPLDKSLLVNILEFKDLNWVIVLNQGSLFFTIFCIYFFYNSLNFSDGLNGISITISLYFMICIILANDSLNLLNFSIILSLLIILVPNLLGKVFLGNSGVSFMSCVLFLLFIKTYIDRNLYFDEIILIVFLPTIDAARITIERIMKGTSPFNSDKNHFHHLLTKIVDQKYVFFPYLIFTILPYTLSKINVATAYCLTIFTVLYFIILFFLKNKNA